ncbi:AAA family ATPase [Treponema sp.]|uniref:AAA family ATPase n=1 Tax=Treponema sp. TaxID=166 RepID=UPI00298DAF7A|nr:AAA family ATPase [Treponema sp.]MCQ2240900.1 AAA family ATPase [Treponema sp.]
MKLIKRNLYLQKLLDVIGTPDIKVITGIRRSGKSKLMDDFISQIQKNNKNANCIHINLNLKKFHKLQNPDEAFDGFWENRLTNTGYFDFAQQCCTLD